MATCARRGIWSVSLLLSLFAPSVLHAATVVRLHDHDLAATADAIITGTVRSLESVARPGSGDVHTLVTISVEEVIGGGLRADEIVLVEPGGRVGNLERRIFGGASYRMGEKVLAFLEQRPDGTFRTAHLALGKFAVVWDRRRHEAVAVRDLGATRVLSPDALGRLVVRNDPRRPVRRFLHHLRRWASQSKPLAIPPVTSPRLASDPSLERQGFPRFTRLGNARWFEPDAGLPVFFQVAGSDRGLGIEASQRAALAAYRAWSDVPTAAIVLADGGTVAPRRSSVCDHESRLVFGDPFDELTDPRRCGGVLAVGGYCSSGDTRSIGGVLYTRIFEGDVIFNNGFERCRFWTETNLAEVATHELGHTIGLGHSSDASPEPDPKLRDATMYFMAHFDGRGAGLRSDDIEGVSAIYPVSEPPPPPDDGPPPDPGPGDPCGDSDLDADEVADLCDNCPLFPNPRQRAGEACVAMERAKVIVRFARSRSRGDGLSLRAILPPDTLDAAMARAASTLTFFADGQLIYEAQLGRGSLDRARSGARLLYRDRTGERIPGLVKLLLAQRPRGGIRLIALVRYLDLGGQEPGTLFVRFRLGSDSFAAVLQCSNRTRWRLRCR